MKLFYLIYFILINCFTVYSYIDPGTGSMLFAVLTGIISTLFFAGKTFFIKIKTMPFIFNKSSEKTESKRKNYVFYSEGRQYWNVFKPVVEEFSERGIECHYYTSDEEDPGLDYKSEYINPLFIGKGNKAYAKLNILEADICLMTTPGLDVYQLERSKGVKHYSHILHASDEATFYKLFSFDYFDSMLLTGEYQKKSIRELEEKRGTKRKELYVAGCTYMDVLSDEIKSGRIKRNNDKTTVLLSPSWGNNAILKKFGLDLIIPLVESGLNVIIRPHPQSSISEKDMLDDLKKKLSGYKNIEWDFKRENLESMIKSDVMISDFSGIIFDYWFLLEKPVIYTDYEFDKRAYDLSDVDDEAWKFKKLDEIGIKLNKDNFKNISRIIDDSLNNTQLLEKIRDAKNTAWQHQGEAGKNCADALIDIHNNLQVSVK